jgi:nitrite reductase/ring-hydroxylating ferredoxin subunit
VTSSSRAWARNRVILRRDRAGGVHVFLNSCRHRGMRVRRYDDGNTAVFSCSYHGWSYGTDGALIGVPFFREAIARNLTKRNGTWRRLRSCVATRGLSGPTGTRRHRHSSNTLATSNASSILSSMAGTGARARQSCHDPRSSSVSRRLCRETALLEGERSRYDRSERLIAS